MSESKQVKKTVLFASKNAVVAANVYEALVERQKNGCYRYIVFLVESQGDRIGVLTHTSMEMGADDHGPKQIADAAEFVAGYMAAWRATA